MTDDYKILIAGTDSALTAKISNTFEKENYKLKAVQSMSDTPDPVQAFHPDLVILDTALTGSDPKGYLQSFWEKTHVPVLVISNAADISNRVLWLEMGADDYLVKPVDLRELAARVHALQRRSSMHPSDSSSAAEPVEYPDLSINLSNYTVICQGTKLHMPPKELELLYFLASSPGQVFTRKQLLHHIWGYEYAGDTRTVDVHIKRLRRKLPVSGCWSIETVWGVGYKFQSVQPPCSAPQKLIQEAYSPESDQSGARPGK